MTSESWASRSTIFPLPSSPHCAPTTTVDGTRPSLAGEGVGARHPPHDQSCSEREHEGGGWAGHPAAHDPDECLRVDRVTTASDPGAGHRTHERLVHRSEVAERDGDEDHERLDELRCRR